MQDHIGQPVGLRHDTLLGNYRILRLLGQGSYANVYLGEHIHLHTQAAIKVLQVRLVESNIQSFLNEARTIAHLVHPYIIRVLDFGVEANTPFLVMDYAPQGTFRQRFLTGKPLPPTPLFPSIKQAASALQYAHDKKLIHRDVKPENMLLGPNEEILLSDFGFALMQTSVSRPSLETAGTASYMAPEQFQGKPQPASDQYSLGVIAYEWLAGSCPFQGTFMELASQHMLAPPPSLLQRVPGLSAQVAQVVMTALAEPEQRFPSVIDFARSLEHACLIANTNFAAPIPPPSFLSGAWTSTAPTQSTLKLEHPTHFQLSAHFPASQPGSNGFSPSLPEGRLSPEQALSSQLGIFQREQTPRPLTSSLEAFQRGQTPPVSPSPTFTPFSQSAANAVGSSNIQSSSVRQTPRPPTAHIGPTPPNMLLARPSEPSFSSSRSQASLPAIPDLPPLPQQPFLAPALGRQNMPVPMAPQTLPLPQNVNLKAGSQSRNFPSLKMESLVQPSLTGFNQQYSPLSTSRQTSLPQSTSLVRAEDFWKKPKPSTSWTLRLFIILMIVLIIGSTALLIILTNNQHNGSKGAPTHQQQSTPRTHATATTVSQQPTQTSVSPTINPTEPNPYGNHNGVLVVNDPLNQQDPQMQWDESPGMCSFNGGSYHVVAGPKSQGFSVCNATASDYANFVYQVQMTITKATSAAGSGGLVFRGNKTNSQFYFFEIFTTGNYAFYRCPGTNQAPCPLLSSSTGGPIAAFHANLDQPNTIALLASGNTFNIYVNSHLAVGPIVDTLNDPAYSEGKIGMMARQNNTTAMTDVSFSNLKIWKMSTAS